MRIFIVEDSKDVRERLGYMLSEIPEVELVGYAEDELGAIKRIGELLPDVVTLDLSLHPESGISVLKYIKKYHVATRVIVLTNYTDRFYADSCKKAGADFFFDKILQFSRVRPAIWSWVHDSFHTSVALEI